MLTGGMSEQRSCAMQMVSGNRAGCVTILLDTEQRFHGPAADTALLQEAEHRPVYIAGSMADVHRILFEELQLSAPA